MLIIEKKTIYSTSYVLAREVRRTDKRVYVEYVAGNTYALDGRRSNAYASLDDVLTDQGTPEMLEAIERRYKEFEAQGNTIRVEAARQYAQARDNYRADLARLIETT